jgi:hypothetical protein
MIPRRLAGRWPGGWRHQIARAEKELVAMRRRR